MRTLTKRHKIQESIKQKSEPKDIITELKNTLGDSTAAWIKQKNGSERWKTKHWNSPRQTSKKKKEF